jgi:hypothetical protein
VPVFVNKDTGLAETADSPSEAQEVPLYSPEGQFGSAPISAAPDLLKQGYRQPNQAELGEMLTKAHFNEPIEQFKTLLEGAASDMSLGTSTALERAVGVPAKNIEHRREYNPGVHMFGQGLGLVTSSMLGYGEGALLTKAGEAIPELVGSRLVTAAARGAAQNAIVQAGDEMSRFISEDPQQSAQTALAHIGLSSLIGAGAGIAFGAIPASFNALAEGKSGEFIDGFKSKLGEYMDSADGAPGKRVAYDPFTKKMTEIDVQPPNLELKDGFDPITKEPYEREPITEEPQSKSFDAGSKVAEMVMKKGLGKMVGGGIGGTIGTAVGHPWIGTYLGERFLSPALDEVIPSITKSIMQNNTSGAGLRSAVEFGTAVVKGETKLNKAINNVFESGREVLSEPSDKDMKRLQTKLDQVATGTDGLQNVGGQIGHYMPEHASVLSMTAANAAQYLNSLKPVPPVGAPLDGKQPVSQVAQNSYESALKIAQEPLSVLSKIKDGTITTKDIQHLQAMYPGLKSRMEYKLINSTLEHKSEEGKIPYKTQLGMSTFLGQPLESSMKQPNIASSQGTFAVAAPPAPSGASKRHNMTSLVKMPSTAQLPGQAREAYRSTGHR